MAGAGNDEKLLRFGCQLVGVFAELPGMCAFTRDEKHRTRRNRLDVIERVEIHELDVAGKRRVRCKFWRRAFRSEFASGGAVEVKKTHAG